jgi:hypothetical protein
MTNLQYSYPQQTLFLRLRDIISRCRDESDNSGISILGIVLILGKSAVYKQDIVYPGPGS